MATITMSALSISEGEHVPEANQRASIQAARRGFQTDPQFLARLTGILFLVTFATSIPPFVSLYVPALKDPTYVLGVGRDLGLSWGALLEMILIVANIGTAIALFPVLRRRNEALALGYVTARVIESVFIAVGILSLLALGTLRLGAEGADSGALQVVASSLVAMHDWSFLLGPGFIVGIGNGLILGYLMWTSRLIPRALPVLGLVGGPALLVFTAAVMFGAIEPGSTWQVIATAPEFFWELSLGIWLMLKGFNTSAVEALTGPRAPLAASAAPQPRYPQ